MLGKLTPQYTSFSLLSIEGIDPEDFSVCLGNGISYALGASREKCIKPQAFLNGCSFIGLLTNGVIRTDKRE